MAHGNLIGQRFGRLIVQELAGQRTKRAAWLCLCDCGNQTVVAGYNLDTGNNIRSCGCLRSDATRQDKITHGDAVNRVITPEYRAWSSMKRRCFNPNAKGYGNYGGRGISVCASWCDDYAAFLADVGRRPSPEYSLGRINNDGHYEPGNVRWETAVEQRHNCRPWGSNRRAA